eukprot:10461120-Lingulodinium_polyedra.AAC.1
MGARVEDDVMVECMVKAKCKLVRAHGRWWRRPSMRHAASWAMIAFMIDAKNMCTSPMHDGGCHA